MLRLKQCENLDLQAITELEKLCFPAEPWSFDMLSAELDNVFSAFTLLLDEDEIVGYVIVHNVAPECELVNIAVAPQHRRKGYGNLLLQFAENSAMEGGCNVMYLEVDERNHDAQKLYYSHGFEPMGARPKYYENQYTALVLSKELYYI